MIRARWEIARCLGAASGWFLATLACGVPPLTSFGSEVAAPGEIGMVTGASFDRNSGRVLLLGDGAPFGIELSEDVVAAAFQWVFPETPRMPYVSIDPVPEDPEGPFMLIDFDPVSRGTEFGWIMFEADRLLKCLALGSENFFGLPEESQVEGYRNLFEWNEALADESAGTVPVWSRFWFHPLSNEVQWDETSMKILDCRVGVKTEVMVLRDGELHSTGGEQDPSAKAFAEHFTSNYRAYGREFPVFLQLEQLARLLLVAEWLRGMREESQPVSLAWVRSRGGDRFAMPSYTPSLRAARESTSVSGDVVRTTRQEIFGGVDLSIEARRSPPGPDFHLWKEAVARAAEAPPESGAFEFPHGRGRALPPGRGHSPDGPLDLLMNGRIGNEVFALEARPERISKETLGDGSGRELALPFLPSYNPDGFEGRVGQIGVEGRPESAIEVRNYELTGPRGERLGVFDAHRVDPVSGEIFVENTKDSASPWTLRPDPNHPEAIWAVEGNERRWAFARGSGEVLAEFRRGRLFQFRYNRRDRLEGIETLTADREVPERLLSLARDRDNGPLVSLRSGDGQRLTLRSEAREAPGPEPYEFDARNEVREVKRLRYSPETDRLELSDGSDPANSGFAPVEPHLGKIRRNGSERDFAMYGEGGYTVIFSAGMAGIIASSPETTLREFVKATALPDETLRRSGIAAMVPENPNMPEVYVSGDFPVFRHCAPMLGNRLSEDQLFVSTADPRWAEISVGMIRSRDMAEGATHQVDVFLESMRGQEGAERALEEVVRRHGVAPLAETAAPVVFIVAHHTEDALAQVKEACRGKRDSLVVVLMCNLSTGATQSQEFAESLVKEGAGSTIVPRGLLDAREASEIVSEADRSPAKPGEDAFEWFQGVLKRAGLENRFGPPTSFWEREPRDNRRERTLPGGPAEGQVLPS